MRHAAVIVHLTLHPLLYRVQEEAANERRRLQVMVFWRSALLAR